MVPGRGDRRSMSVAVRRTCGAESELGKGKIGRGRRVQTQRTKKKPPSTHKFEFRRVRLRESKLYLHRRNARCTHQRMQWSDTRSILLLCACRAATSPTGLSEGVFCWVEGRCCLAPADQVSDDSTTKTTSDKNMVPRRKKKVTACVRTARTVSKDAILTLLAEVLTASPAWGFFSSETMYFERLFEVLALTFRSTCKTGGRCLLAPSWPVGRPLYVLAMVVV